MATPNVERLHSHSSSRNKENRSPALGTDRRARSSIPSLVKSPDKSDFFTDSYLADRDASQLSLIPSPSPAKPAAARNRRQHRPKWTSKSQLANGRSLHRHAQSELHAPREKSPPTRRSSIGLSTPPHSRDGLPIASPYGHLPSSPPPALVENYERIDQEQDLAATEGEISDSDRNTDNEDFLARPLTNRSSAFDLPHVQTRDARSRASVPTPDRPAFRHRRLNRHDDNMTITSDPTGAIDFTDKSFLDGLSDAGLAEKLTPFLSQSAKDRQRLRQVWANHKPIAFGKAGKTRMESPILSRPSLVSPEPVDHKRTLAFTKAGRIKLESDYKANAHLSPSLRDAVPVANGVPSVEPLPLNTRVQRTPFFKQNHGFPAQDLASPRENLPSMPLSGRPQRAMSDTPSAPYPQPTEPTFDAAEITNLQSPPKSPDPVASLNGVPSRNHVASPAEHIKPMAIDDGWTGDEHSVRLPAQKPVLLRAQSMLSESGYETSPEKSRRLDFDFTGQSFQVSESPPVRSRTEQDYAKAREIQGLAKQAVTTNRLNQIRARESAEFLRQSSRSPLPDLPETTENALSENGVSHNVGEAVPNTPVVIYRTSSNGQTKNSTSTERPLAQRSTSHEVLHRLSRGSSGTPKVPTPPGRAFDGGNDHEQQLNDVELTPAPNGIRSTSFGRNVGSLADRLPQLQPMKHSQTPKVTGAWTDTILPDTVKTAKVPTRSSAYAQTPHVSAGGWVDTPAPSSIVARLESLAEDTQEFQADPQTERIPAELMNGIAKDSASDATLRPRDEIAVNGLSHKEYESKSLVKKVLDDARNKLQQTREKDDGDDSLNLNNTTIQSLEDFLMDETDMTILSTLGGPHPIDMDADTAHRLGSKLDRVIRNIHDARKGISKLEHQLSSSTVEETKLEGYDDGTKGTAKTLETARHGSSTRFPLQLVTVAFPVPILWRSPRSELGQKFPHLTLLGWIVFSTLGWYIIECTLAVIYGRPQYAETYIWPDQPEPEFPFVLPTMLWRWSCMDFLQPLVIRPVLKAVVAFYKMLGMLVGWTDGFADASAKVTTAAEATAEALYNAADLDMMNDEFL